MPFLTVYTNVDFKNGAELAEAASEVVAEVLRKPISYVAVGFIYNPAMAFGGSAANRGALAELKSIGLGNKDELVKSLTAFLSQQLNISEQQYINIALADSPAAYTACNGHTFG